MSSKVWPDGARTRQVLAPVEPLAENTAIGLMIGCGNCPSQRTFKLDRNLELLLTRQAAGVLIETECESCGHLIAVALSWIDPSEGFSGRPHDGRILENAVDVFDNVGLLGAEDASIDAD